MSTDLVDVCDCKVKEFGEKLTVALKMRSYERMEVAAEAFIGLFEGENIVAIDKFIEHVRVVYNGIDSYYNTSRVITSEVLNASKERRRSNLRSNPGKDHDQAPRE